MKKEFVLWLILLLPYLGLLFAWLYYKNEITKMENATFIVISKEEMSLTLYDYKGTILEKYPVACGKNWGNKQNQGDMKTPEGTFSVCDIQKADHWKHDFGDGAGGIPGAYGPFFIRLLTPGHQGIGIHGTHDENSIGTRATEGCVRMKNKDLEKLVKKIKIGTVVVITPAKPEVDY